MNVKLTYNDKIGSPNMGSINRLINRLVAKEFSHFYIIYVIINRDTKTFEVKEVDLLDNLNFVTFDAGPGQLMLNATKFSKGPIDQTKHLIMNHKIVMLRKLRVKKIDSKIVLLNKKKAGDLKYIEEAGEPSESRDPLIDDIMRV